MISDLREIWPDVEENTVLLHMILSYMLVEADLSDHEVELDIAWEEGKVKVIIALGVVYTNGDLPRRKSVPSRLPPPQNIHVVREILGEAKFPKWYLHGEASLDNPLVQKLDRAELAKYRAYSE
jgi:hypothetical protein